MRIRTLKEKVHTRPQKRRFNTLVRANPPHDLPPEAVSYVLEGGAFFDPDRHWASDLTEEQEEEIRRLVRIVKDRADFLARMSNNRYGLNANQAQEAYDTISQEQMFEDFAAAQPSTHAAAAQPSTHAAAAQPSAPRNTTKVVLCFAMKQFAEGSNKIDVDNMRIQAFNRYLQAQHRHDPESPQRVLTVSDYNDSNSPYHISMDFRQVGSMNTINAFCVRNGYEIVDVYLDYYFLLRTYYYSNYGQNWIAKLKILNYSGTAFLPIIADSMFYASQIRRRDPEVEAVRGSASDYQPGNPNVYQFKYMYALIKDLPEPQPYQGRFVTGTADEIAQKVPLCKVSRGVRSNRPEDSARTHKRMYNKYCDGFLAITRLQATGASDSLPTDSEMKKSVPVREKRAYIRKLKRKISTNEPTSIQQTGPPARKRKRHNKPPSLWRCNWCGHVNPKQKRANSARNRKTLAHGLPHSKIRVTSKG